MLNNSKTKADIKILALGKIDQHDEIYPLSNFRENPFTDVGVIALEMPIFANLLDFELFLLNNSKMKADIKILAWGKIDQHDQIYLWSNFRENLFTDVGVIALL